MLQLERDKDLVSWIYGLVDNQPTKPGDFLKAIAEAAVRADYENYQILQPALKQLSLKYPEYKYIERKL